MKKFLVTVFALVVLAGLGLFFGWAQRGVPPDSYGVLRTRSHGTEAALIVPGEFRWVWYKLIPTNSRTLAFRLAPVERRFRASGELPSGRIYAAFTGIPGDFSWEIDATVSFSLRPDALVPLVKERNIGSQADLDSYLAGVADSIGATLVAMFDRGDAYVAAAGALLFYGEMPALTADIARRFPELVGLTVRINSARLPDFAMYGQAREQHREFLSLQREHIAEGLSGLTMERIGAFSRIAELELYGDLLTRFPILLQYLMIEGRLAE